MSNLVLTGTVTDPEGNSSSAQLTIPVVSETPVGLFGTGAVAGPDSDSASTELGVKFTSDADGQVTGVRFYKHATNTGVHIVSLWSPAGSLLGQATVTGETASGWQTQLFATPVSITAGLMYTASYRAPVGKYAYVANQFPSPLHAPPLHAPASAGVYKYGASAMPTLSFSNGGYGVDILFLAGPAPPPPPPPPGIPAFGTFVTPGTVGYKTSMGPQTTYAVGATPPPGCSWQSYGLRVDADNPTWVNFKVAAPVYWNGTGTFTMTGCTIDARNVADGGTWTGPLAGAVVNHAVPAGNFVGYTLTDCTFLGSDPPDQDIGSVGYGGKMLMLRCDFSGYPQGLDVGPGSRITQCVVSNLVQPRPGDPQHMDGLFLQGADIQVSQCYVQAPIRSDVTAALFIQNYWDGTNFTAIKLYANFFSGGGFFSVRNQNGTAVDLINNAFGNGEVALHEGPGTWGTVSGNAHQDGSAVSVT